MDPSAWPSGRYVATNGKDLGAGLRLVPDFVRTAYGYVIVFDAKFYTTDALPDSYSVLKQLAYGLFLSEEWHDSGIPPERIIHVFLFPKLGNLGGRTASMRGQHKISPQGRAASMRAPIFLVDLDYETVANAYLRHREIEVGIVACLPTRKFEVSSQ